MKKILFLGVNPVDTNRLRLDEEAREIAQALRGARKREQFDSKQSWAVTDNDLRQALLDYEPEIVHFSGHGEGEEGLKFEDETGSTRLIPPEALADLFRLCAKHVQCVILNTCYSEPQAEAIFQHISYVIGTKGAIDDAAAIRFSRGFYDALMAGRNFKEAFEFGRNAIATRNMPDYQLFVIKEKNPGESPELTSDLRFDTVTSANIVSVDSVWMDDDFERTLWGDPDADPERSATKMQREYMEFVGKIPACNELLYQVREFFSVYSKKFSYSSKPVFAYKITLRMSLRVENVANQVTKLELPKQQEQDLQIGWNETDWPLKYIISPESGEFQFMPKSSQFIPLKVSLCINNSVGEMHYKKHVHEVGCRCFRVGKAFYDYLHRAARPENAIPLVVKIIRIDGSLQQTPFRVRITRGLDQLPCWQGEPQSLIRAYEQIDCIAGPLYDEEVHRQLREQLELNEKMELDRQSKSEIDKKELVHLFYSYSHKDEGLRDELQTHLSLLKRQGILHDWHDRKIAAGREWEGAIDENQEAADVILLLVSADFLASDYCYDREMKRALEKHEAGEVRVIPVIIRPVDWSGAPFSKLQALPKDAKPVTSWSNRDEAWTDVARGIRKAVEEITANPR